MHALSLGTWWIHVASVIEWCIAIVLMHRRGLPGMAWAMLPALISAMAACTWHLFDNSEALRGFGHPSGPVHRDRQQHPGLGGLATPTTPGGGRSGQ